MTKKEFMKASRLGLGTAFNADIESGKHDRQLFKLLTKNNTHDIQSEGDRSWYAYKLWKQSPSKKSLFKKFKKVLNFLDENFHWGQVDHVLQVAYKFTKGGQLKPDKLIDKILRLQEANIDYLVGEDAFE